MGIDFALSTIFLLDVGTSDNVIFFSSFYDICVVQICCFVWCILLYYCLFLFSNCLFTCVTFHMSVSIRYTLPFPLVSDKVSPR